MANQGIAHLAFRVGGEPFCKKRGSHISVTVDDRLGYKRICRRCEAVLLKREKRAASKRQIDAPVAHDDAVDERRYERPLYSNHVTGPRGQWCAALFNGGQIENIFVSDSLRVTSEMVRANLKPGIVVRWYRG